QKGQVKRERTTMRVLLTSHRFPPDGIAGVERYTQNLAAALSKAGHAVTVVTRRPSSSRQVTAIHERLPDGTVVHRLTGGGFHLDPLDDQQLEQLERLFLAALIESNADVLHLNHLLGLSPRFPEIAHRHGVAIVVSLHDFYFACPLV